MNTYGIYVKTDDQGRIVSINSEGHIKNFDDWIRVGEYESDFSYAQGDAFGEPIIDERGVSRYKLEGGLVARRSKQEMDLDVVPDISMPNDTDAALVELAGIVAEQQAALIELANMIAKG